MTCLHCNDTGFLLEFAGQRPYLADGWMTVTACTCHRLPNDAAALTVARSAFPRRPWAIIDELGAHPHYLLLSDTTPTDPPSEWSVEVDAVLPTPTFTSFEFAGIEWIPAPTTEADPADVSAAIHRLVRSAEQAARLTHPSARRWAADEHTFVTTMRQVLASLDELRDRSLEAVRITGIAYAEVIHPDRDRTVIPDDRLACQARLAVSLGVLLSALSFQFPTNDGWSTWMRTSLNMLDDVEAHGSPFVTW